MAAPAPAPAPAPRRVVLYDLPGWLLVSRQGGRAYELGNRQAGRVLVFEGPVARSFVEELQLLTSVRPGRATLSMSDALAVLWSQLSYMSTPWHDPKSINPAAK